MTTPARPIKWGIWFERRVRAVGFANGRALADAAGISRFQFSRWTQMHKPPANMAEAVKASLARALRIDPAVLLIGWREFDPETLENMASGETLRTRARIIAQQLNPMQLCKLIAFAEQLLAGTPTAEAGK